MLQRSKLIHALKVIVDARSSDQGWTCCLRWPFTGTFAGHHLLSANRVTGYTDSPLRVSQSFATDLKHAQHALDADGAPEHAAAHDERTYIMPPAIQHEAYVFDAYGTLFDVHAAVRRHASDIGPDGLLLSEIWRNKQLEYSWVRSLMGAYVDFWKLTEQALDFAIERVPSVASSHRDTLLEAYWKLDCYEEVPTVLKALKDQGTKLAILSNGSREMLESAVQNAALDTILDDIFSVEDVGTFKTAPAVYEMATTAYRLYPNAVSFQSSNRWDIAGASKFGFRTVWINRASNPDEYLDFPPDVVLPSLQQL